MEKKSMTKEIKHWTDIKNFESLNNERLDELNLHEISDETHKDICDSQAQVYNDLNYVNKIRNLSFVEKIRFLFFE